MQRIQRIGPKSVAKLSGVLYALLGLIIGVLFFIISLLIPGKSPGSGALLLFGIATPIIFPILYGGIGFVFGLVIAWLYNLVAKWVGGIEVEIN